MATEVIDFFSGHYQGFVVLILVAFALAFFVQWICWIFGWGRFAGGPVTTPGGSKLQSLRFLIADALTKIINDFRHLLALILVLIFAAALIYVLYASGRQMDQIKEGLQAVVATLGGLIGSIIGYYFGESSARQSVSSAALPPAALPSGMAPVAPPVPEIRPAPTPGGGSSGESSG